MRIRAQRFACNSRTTRPGDIDVIWVYGYGWPVWRGGPMYYADRLGLPHLRDRLTLYAEHSGDETLQPAALIRRTGFGTPHH